MNGTPREALAEGERVGRRYRLSPPPRPPVSAAGVAPGSRAGNSLDFREYREYQPGDDVRHLDWNVFARSDQLTVKTFREETTPHLDLVIDASRSMALADSAKERAALALAAFFATAARASGFSHAVWRAGAAVERLAGGDALPAGWAALDFDHAGSPAEGLTRARPFWRPRGLRVLLSDLLWAGDPREVVAPMADQGSALVVVQVLAQEDVEPAAGMFKLVDAETGRSRELMLDAAAVRRYRERLTRHQEAWRQGCRRAGAVFAVAVAERLLQDWRLDELTAAAVLRVV